MVEVFLEYRPEVVFHAAAHKHVPILEEHPQEALLTNVLGTANVVEAAALVGTERFVMISTDKAVQPASVMGGSKRMAEQIVRGLAGRDTVFCAVRFGNVLGSRGSVVPTFLAQIAAGGPVTVTDPTMTRYFMSVEEAVQLVLQASTLAAGGEVFTLEMGEPVNIMELAQEADPALGPRPGSRHRRAGGRGPAGGEAARGAGGRRRGAGALRVPGHRRGAAAAARPGGAPAPAPRAGGARPGRPSRRAGRPDARHARAVELPVRGPGQRGGGVVSVRAVVVAHREALAAEGIAAALARYPALVPVGVATSAAETERLAAQADAVAIDARIPGSRPGDRAHAARAASGS